MGHFAGFDYDIFVSYDSIDDSPNTEFHQGWVTDFCDNLTRGFKNKYGDTLDIYFDRRHLAPHDDLQNRLEKVRRSAIFLAVLSPAYIQSPRIAEELKSIRSNGGDDTRILAVQIAPLNQRDLPPEFQTFQRHSFWVEETAHRLDPTRDVNEYNSCMRALIVDLQRRLINMRGQTILPANVSSNKQNNPHHSSLIQELIDKCNANGTMHFPSAEAHLPSINIAGSGLRIPLVFINAHLNDKSDAEAIKSQFGSRIPCVMPLSFYDEKASIERISENLNKNLVECDALITVWRNASEAWLHAQLRQLRKIMHRRAEPLQLNVVAMSPDREHAIEGNGDFNSVELISMDRVGQFVAAEFDRSLQFAYAAPRSLGSAASTPNQVGEGHDPENGTKIDIVDFSAFSPFSAHPNDEVLVQVFLHCPDEAALASALAEQADPETKPRGVATLTTEINRGQKIGISLDAPGLTIDQPIQHMIWRGDPRSCQFLVRLPSNVADQVFQLRVRVLLDHVPIGMLRFTLKCAAAHEPVGLESEIRGDWAKRYRRAFLSYASPDRAEVLKRSMMLKAVGIDFFLDLLTLDAGERWEARLYEEIDRCDIFLLFWSSNAARSDWVIREAEYALSRHEGSAEEAPDVIPIVIEGPPVIPPPDSLKKIHFNDPISYIIAGIEAEKRGQ